MNIVIDRFEDEYILAELENKTIVKLPKILFPDAQEGDVITLYINHEETESRKENIKKLMDDLWED